MEIRRDVRVVFVVDADSVGSYGYFKND